MLGHDSPPVIVTAVTFPTSIEMRVASIPLCLRVVDPAVYRLTKVLVGEKQAQILRGIDYKKQKSFPYVLSRSGIASIDFPNKI
jgi:hypothetical protein